MSAEHSTPYEPRRSIEKHDLEASPLPLPALQNPSLSDPTDVEATTPLRPPILYTSPYAFGASVWRRFASLWTRRFVLSLVAGQVVSLCITCTNVTTTELVMRNWSLPTTQTWFL